jgi:2-oxoglutarate ferredoxin oxidoreductase subunit beta
VSTHDVSSVLKAKAAIKKGFEYQRDKKGFALIEILTSCPTNWGLTPKAALDYIRDTVMPYYLTGVYKDIGEAVK